MQSTSLSCYENQFFEIRNLEIWKFQDRRKGSSCTNGSTFLTFQMSSYRRKSFCPRTPKQHSRDIRLIYCLRSRTSGIGARLGSIVLCVITGNWCPPRVISCIDSPVLHQEASLQNTLEKKQTASKLVNSPCIPTTSALIVVCPQYGYISFRLTNRGPG